MLLEQFLLLLLAAVEAETTGKGKHVG